MVSCLRVLLVVLCGSLSLIAADRPNILWVTSEDNSYHWLGCYGNAQAHTPNLDRLASEGVLYRHAYANAPVCAVARCTLITGRYACSLGTQNMRSRYPIPETFRTYVSYLREAGYYCVNRSKTDYNFRTDDKSHWDASSNKAHWKNAPEGKPFFAIFNTGISHESSLFAKKKRPPGRRLNSDSIELPPYLPDTPELRQDAADYLDIVSAMDAQIGAWLHELEEAGERDNTIVMYYSDHGGILPRAKRYVYDTGTRVPFLVRIPPKWAHLAGEKPGSQSDRLVSFIDLPPTLLSLAGMPIPPQMQGRAFLGPGLQTAEPYVFLFGQRFDSRMLRFVRAVTDGRYRYIANFHPHRHRGILAGYPHGQAGWRSYYALQQAGKTTPEQDAMWRVPQPVEELYDTQADPWEVQNLVGDPAHQKRLAIMRAATLAKMRAIRDTGIVPESMYPGLSAKGTVHDYVQDPSFPYDELLERACLASQGAISAADLQQGLSHDHPVARYWSALGCTIQPTLDSADIRAALTHLLRDPVPTVQLAAAEALAVRGVAAGGTHLKEILAGTNNDMLALEGLNLVLAHKLTHYVPRNVFRRACETGSYPQRMMDDYP